MPDLDLAERTAFAEFTRIQGMAYLQSVDDWLQQRRVRRKVKLQRKRGVAASVHLVAYLGDEPRAKPPVPTVKPSPTRLKHLPEARA